MNTLAGEKTAEKIIKSKKKLTGGRLKQQLVLQSMVIPGAIYLFIFAYIPLFGIMIAFQDYDLYAGFFGSSWVGFKHFAEFFSNDNFFVLMRNTLCISFLKLLFGFPMPIILAILFNALSQENVNVKLKCTISAV